MSIFKQAWAYIATLLLAACTQLNFAVVNLPAKFSDVQVMRNVAFGPAGWEKLDIYTPANAPTNGTLPVVVFYYGGRWEEGAKGDYAFVGSVLAKQGFVVVIPDYRKYPDVKFPVFVQDAAKSLAWTSDHIGRYGGNADDIHVSGHSAGAHIASLLTVDARYLQREGKDRNKVIRDFTGLAGPYDFTPDEPDLKDMFGPPSQYAQMKATTFVDGRQPPMFLLWGDKDQYVGKQNIDRLAGAVRTHGGCVKTAIYPGIDHVWLLASLSWLGKPNSVLQDWTGFMRHNGCGKSQGG